MSKQTWKALALFLGSLLIALIILIGSTPISNKLLAQVTSVTQCGVSPTSWEFQAVQSLIERYGVAGANVCKNGKFQGDHPEVRADMADWLATALDRVNELLEASTSDLASKKEFDELNRLYEQMLAQVEALEKKC